MKFNKTISKLLFFCISMNFLTTNFISNAEYDKKLHNQSDNIDYVLDDTLSPMSYFKKYMASSVVNDMIYVTGGVSDYAILSDMEMYNTLNNSWENKTNMTTPRKQLTTSVVNGKIYAIGGFNHEINGYDSLRTVEAYDPKTDTWETKSSMSIGRSGLASAVVDNKIYVIGGNITEAGGSYPSSNYLGTLEVYDPKTDRWETKTPMPTNRQYFNAVAVEKKIYCIGGQDNSSFLNTVEVYDTETDTWETKANMLESRAIFSAHYFDGKIYAIGGFNGKSINSIETYNIETDTWKSISSFIGNIHDHTSVIIDDTVYLIGGVFNGLSSSRILSLRLISEAEKSVIKAESSPSIENITSARKLINALPEGNFKNTLQERLNVLSLNESLKLKNSTSNIDLYIKLENALSISLTTNSITFNNYTGVEDIELNNAVNISISSSLPYQLNAYLATYIENADKSRRIDTNRLNIKESSETNYKEFTSVNNKLILKDICFAGDNTLHNIDLKLKGGDAYPADVYKAVIKFEAEQK